MRVSALRIVMGLGLIGALGACEFGPADIPAYLANNSGSQQTVAPGAQAAQPLTVIVRDQDRDPIENVEVFWAVKSGSGTLGSPSSTTSGSGIASMNFTAGSTVGTTVVSATVPALGAGVTFTMIVK
jgi:hypothetical protein